MGRFNPLEGWENITPPAVGEWWAYDNPLDQPVKLTNGHTFPYPAGSLALVVEMRPHDTSGDTRLMHEDGARSCWATIPRCWVRVPADKLTDSQRLAAVKVLLETAT